MNRLTSRRLVWQICVTLLLIFLNALPAASQDKRAKVRISNAGFTITALPLLAAQDWGTFSTNGSDVELIVMSPPIAAGQFSQPIHKKRIRQVSHIEQQFHISRRTEFVPEAQDLHP